MHYRCFDYHGYRVHIKSSDTVPDGQTTIEYVSYGPNDEAFEVMVSPALWQRIVDLDGIDAVVTGFTVAIQTLIAKNYAPLN